MDISTREIFKIYKETLYESIKNKKEIKTEKLYEIINFIIDYLALTETEKLKDNK